MKESEDRKCVDSCLYAITGSTSQFYCRRYPKREVLPINAIICGEYIHESYGRGLEPIEPTEDPESIPEDPESIPEDPESIPEDPEPSEIKPKTKSKKKKK